MRNTFPKAKPDAMWNDPDNERDERPRNVEEQVEQRRKKKRLVDCELPEGFHLVTPWPKQFWIGTQVRWGFQLAWAKVDRNGNRGEEETFVAQYEPTIADEVQMRWALDDFSRKLEVAGTNVKAPALNHKIGRDAPRLQVFLTMRVAS